MRRDTLWILKGLLVSGMRQCAAGMVRNLAALVQRYGCVPNGARTYYLNRSQPPLLSAMVKLLHGDGAEPSLLRDTYPVSSGRRSLGTRLPAACEPPSHLGMLGCIMGEGSLIINVF